MESAHIYICGNVRMAADVTETLIEILQIQGNMNIENAKNMIDMLKVR